MPGWAWLIVAGVTLAAMCYVLPAFGDFLAGVFHRGRR